MVKKCTSSIDVLDGYSEICNERLDVDCGLEKGHTGKHEFTDYGTAEKSFHRSRYYTKYTITWE